jgi:hypothetical protein
MDFSWKKAEKEREEKDIVMVMINIMEVVASSHKNDQKEQSYKRY